MSNNKVVVYCAGGAGINIGSTLENFRAESEPGIAPVDAVYLDTSRSNLKPNMPEDKIYILEGEGIDGSGKERRQNAGPIMRHVKEMLQKHRPGYVNVIVASASGGSGAVIAAVLAKELLEQDQLVILVTIGVADSGVEIKNTLDALKTFEGISTSVNKSVPVAYFENNKDTPMTEVDEQIMQLIVAISVIFSRNNEGLDTRDLYNFLNIDRVSQFKPHTVGLKAYARDLVKEEHEETITVASVVSDKDHRGIDFILPYTCYGVLPEGVNKDITSKAPIHLVTTAYPFNEIAKSLKSYLTEMERQAAARTKESELLSDKDDLTGGFLAL